MLFLVVWQKWAWPEKGSSHHLLFKGGNLFNDIRGSNALVMKSALYNVV